MADPVLLQIVARMEELLATEDTADDDYPQLPGWVLGIPGNSAVPSGPSLWLASIEQGGAAPLDLGGEQIEATIGILALGVASGSSPAERLRGAVALASSVRRRLQSDPLLTVGSVRLLTTPLSVSTSFTVGPIGAQVQPSAAVTVQVSYARPYGGGL